MKFHIARPAELQGKIERMKQGGINNLHLVADFDCTLTKAFINGKKFVSSYALLREGDYLGEEYSRQAYELYDIYHAYEKDEELPLDFRKEKMVEWWSKHFELLKKCRMNKKIITDVVKTGKIKLREGGKELFSSLQEKKIPLLILSAGLGDIIKEFLQSQKVLSSNMHIISNFYEYDNESYFTGFKTDYVHSLNKNEIEVKKTSYHLEIEQRKNVILLGDKLSDLSMGEGLEHDTIIKISFLNENVEELLPRYGEKFDVVILNDGNMDYVNQLLTEIL